MILRCEQTNRHPREIRITNQNNEKVGSAFIPKIFIADMKIFDESYRLETKNLKPIYRARQTCP